MKKRKFWVNAVNRTDWSPHEIFSNFIMFGAFVDAMMDGTVSVMTQSFHATKNT